ncbi:unnamed protein product [Nesidiocoris tenuis]|uniref:Uncharacterized protein n=1 Tax=Nesidiocoris tenuis TaxID=355587 RepID=A0A6H5GJU7_9HEMI|nr:unnamed protein product [Nesidiocoris tenuis]
MPNSPGSDATRCTTTPLLLPHCLDFQLRSRVRTYPRRRIRRKLGRFMRTLVTLGTLHIGRSVVSFIQALRLYPKPHFKKWLLQNDQHLSRNIAALLRSKADVAPDLWWNRETGATPYCSFPLRRVDGCDVRLEDAVLKSKYIICTTDRPRHRLRQVFLSVRNGSHNIGSTTPAENLLNCFTTGKAQGCGLEVLFTTGWHWSISRKFDDKSYHFRSTPVSLNQRNVSIFKASSFFEGVTPGKVSITDDPDETLSSSLLDFSSKLRRFSDSAERHGPDTIQKLVKYFSYDMIQYIRYLLCQHQFLRWSTAILQVHVWKSHSVFYNPFTAAAKPWLKLIFYVHLVPLTLIKPTAFTVTKDLKKCFSASSVKHMTCNNLSHEKIIVTLRKNLSKEQKMLLPKKKGEMKLKTDTSGCGSS